MLGICTSFVFQQINALTYNLLLSIKSYVDGIMPYVRSGMGTGTFNY